MLQCEENPDALALSAPTLAFSPQNTNRPEEDTGLGREFISA
jgi:hypothetical protein